MAIFLLWTALAAGADEAALNTRHVRAGQQDEAVAAEPRPLFEIHKQLRHLLREEAVRKDRRAWKATVVHLVELYGEITRDERLPTSNSLSGYRIKLRSRLLQIQKKLERELAQKDGDATTTKSLAAKPNAAKNAGSGRQSGSLSDQPAQDQPKSGAGGGAPADYGSDLVELIRRTISPDFWDVNGGPGSIVYYRQWHVLVIRATPEIHERIGGPLFGGLRK